MRVRSCYAHEVEVVGTVEIEERCLLTHVTGLSSVSIPRALHRCTRCGALFLNPPDDSAALEAEERAMDFDHADAEAHCWDTSGGDE